MSFSRFRFVTVTFAATALFSALAYAAPSADAPVTRAELPDLVKQAILNNPDIIMQAAQKLREKQQAQGDKQAHETLEKRRADIYKDDSSPMVGNKNGDITVVEFFDYHCGYCKHVLPTISQLIKDDKKVRVVFKEFPILSDDSVTAARAALAAYRIAPDKYFAYHTELMKSSGKFDEKSLLDAAKNVGIDPDELKAAMAKTNITQELDKNRSLAKDMGISGTPALIIGNKLVPGAMSYEDLKKAVDQARSGKGESPKS